MLPEKNCLTSSAVSPVIETVTASEILPFPKLETLIGLPPLPALSATGSCLRLALTAAARSFLESFALLAFDIHFGFGSPGFLAHGPTTLPFESILFQSPSGWSLENHCLKSSSKYSSNSSSISSISFDILLSSHSLRSIIFSSDISPELSNSM